MPRPYWMELGNISDGGVPSHLGEGHNKVTRGDRLRHARKMGERRNMQEWMQKNLRKNQLSPWQIKAGARKVI